MDDTVVIDIETANFFSDAEVGWHNFEALRISVVGAYSYARDRYFCFEENELDDLWALLAGASLVVGFSSNRYDIPVLNCYCGRRGILDSFNLFAKERLDLLEEIERVTGRRISLNRLAAANLGREKTGSGAEAIYLFRDGRIAELKEYCLADVKITKDLFDLYRSRKYFFLPRRDGAEMEKVEFHRPARLV